MGIKSPLNETPSLPLGSSDVNLMELVNAYAVVANNGMHVEPVLVSKILNVKGEVVYEAQPQQRRALPYRAAFYMQKMLEAGVRDGGGTSQTLGAMMYMGGFNGQIDFGGKTGTSNNHSDAWFVGVTPALVGGAWVGGEYRSIHFRTGRLGQGSRTALPIFGLFMKKVLSDPALKDRYMQRYGKPAEEIPVNSYQGYYVAPAEEPDSLLGDSLEVVQDLMGGEGSPLPEQEQRSEPASKDGDPAAVLPESLDKTEDLSE